ncbi:hypothetical protein ACTMU2_20755 [Cupriavidus basilensis]
MPSSAGHDAQMLARMCPAGMIFVPSVGGLATSPDGPRPRHPGGRRCAARPDARTG